ncbi:carboxypeptidase-like regulatory domain-containing protein [Mesonia ostreae]|uniref:Carboxypeptidase-like regulatory domain-containing protein n=1 Tax=Mesonia ostreae TaxID=861110 RepID=A0ABU2KIG3_9FLAO|nr:carboxypeptidase-like regulatory domain-containing protein [Mesonia ostreae]MDT0294477.1 carboxypeptidase-like regulatory domain-containing protein [Mesonia ostreae]
MPFYLFSYSQNKVSGYVKVNDAGIEGGSVKVLTSENNILHYTYTEKNGFYQITFNANVKELKLSASSLGYKNEIKTINFASEDELNVDFNLEEETSVLNEVVLKFNQKIKINRDTTTIAVNSYKTGTEQTIEDVLKNLPGIQVLENGTIKAHGKPIQKLLIEGEDLLDKNYKILTKNIDAEVLSKVQILDNFEDNPIMKKVMQTSDKVALNLKLDENKKNIWFGNINFGGGLGRDFRFQESFTLGLLKKKIKLFYLGDFNNLGNKATDQIEGNQNSNELFGEDRIEHTTQNFYTNEIRENNSFSNSQSTFNKAFFNSLSLNTKIQNRLKIRATAYFANDIQKQNNFKNTQYNIGENPIEISENNYERSRKTLSSGEVELKYFNGKNSYLRNLLIVKTNPYRFRNHLRYNNSKEIGQSVRGEQKTIFNHFNYTQKLTNNTLLNTYLYYGYDNVKQRSTISSELLNNYLDLSSSDTLQQTENNTINYIGLKPTLIYKTGKIENAFAVNFEHSKETINENILSRSATLEDSLINDLVWRQNAVIIENNFRYRFNSKISLTANLNYLISRSKINSDKETIKALRPKAILNYKTDKIGKFILSYSINNERPEISKFLGNYFLEDYRAFSRGKGYNGLLKNQNLSFSHNLFNDLKRFSLSTTFSYTKAKKAYTSNNTITESFSFLNYILRDGGENYFFNSSLVNYFKKLKLVTEFETDQNWNKMPVKLNTAKFNTLNNYMGKYAFSGLTYFNFPLNFDFGISYTYSQSKYLNNTVNSEVKKAHINLNAKLSSELLVELKNDFYDVENAFYSFMNFSINYTPNQSALSFRLLINNILNEKEYKALKIDNYTSNTTIYNLVPRYFLISGKYRF